MYINTKLLKHEIMKRTAEIKPTRKATGGETTEVAGGALSGAMTGFQLGGPWGALGGAIIGGGVSVMGVNAKEKARRKQRSEQEKQKRNNLIQGDKLELANYLDGNGQGFDLNTLYATGGEEKPAESTTPTTAKLNNETIKVTNYETLKYELQKLGLKDYIDVMNTDEDTAYKIKSIVKKQVLSNPNNFKEHLSVKDGIENSINLNTLIPTVLPASGGYGMAGSSGVTYHSPTPFKLPDTFANGGELNPNESEVIDGGIMPVASNAAIAVGKTHAQGGIKLTPDTEIENNETVIKNKEGNLDIFSDQLGYAKVANPLVIEKGRLEQLATIEINKLNAVLAKYDATTDKFKKNSTERMIEGSNTKIANYQKQIAEIDSQLTDIFNEQEATQGRTDNTKTMLSKGGTVKMAATGAEISKGLELAAPFIDNVGNYIANKKLAKMKIPKPTMTKAYNLDPNIDVSASIAAINESTQNTKKFIEANTANSNVARDVIQSMYNQQGVTKSQIIQDKNNKEQEIKMRNVANNNQVQNENNQKLDNYQAQVFEKDIQTKITNPSQNLANVESNIKDIISGNRLEKFQNKQIELQKQITQPGVWDDIDPIIKNLTKEQYIESLRKSGRDEKYIQSRVDYHIKQGTFK